MAPKKSTITVSKEIPPVDAAAAPVPETVAAPEPEAVVEAVADTVAETVDPIQVKLAKLSEYVAARTVAAKDELQSCKELAALIKALGKEIALVQKKSNARRQPKKQKQDGQKQSGFTKEVPLSDALCDFLGSEHGCSAPRINVTRHISKYINDNNLFDASDRRHILPDEKLSVLLGIKDADPPVNLTYFNLQTYMKKHFLKDTPVTETATASASETEASA